jgi:tetratricopeptide (TPR) repeat protein
VYRGVYVKFSSLDPLTTVREAMGVAFKLPKGEVESLGLIELFQKGIEAAAQGSPDFKALILIFDQFEQFFVYTDDLARRSAFIEALATWYNNEALKERVKILVAIREDWFSRMDEIQAVLGYSLRVGGQTGENSFYLRNFSAEEATMILAVMAQEDLGIAAEDTERFDRNYMQEVLERELASGADHLISPVDLQIVADAINQQNTAQMRAFNRTALQRLGGIEGLRRSFLEGILEPLGPEWRKAAVQVLVALTNLEQQTRAEVQSLAQVQEKVKGIMPPQEVEKITGSLQETGLITRVERNGVQGYELAHEGMIGAVIRLGEKVQDGAYRANQLLERRVNEWLGNGRSARYLFNGRELWALEREKRFLVWGSKREQKQRLIAKSKQRVGWIFGLFTTVLLGAMGFWGWLNYTVLGNITQVRWRLAEVIQQGISSDRKAKAAIAFAKDGNLAQASKLASQVDASSSSKANVLSATAEAYGRLNQSEKGLPLLKEALAAAQKNYYYSSSTTSTLRAIAEAYGKLNQPEKGLPLLKESLTATQAMYNSGSRTDALMAIAEAYDKLNQPEKGLPLLKEALTAAREFSGSKASALSTIAETYVKLNQSEKGLLLLKEALTAAEREDSASALSDIAEVYGKLNQPEKGFPLLEPLLKEALTTAQKIDDSSSLYKVYWLNTLAETYGKLNQPEKGLPSLKEALTTAQKIDDSDHKVDALSGIAEAYGKLNQPEKGLPLLKEALTTAQKIDLSYSKASALSGIAEAEANLKNWRQALKVVQQCPSKDCEVESLAKILTIYAEQQHPELKEEEEE